MKSKRKALQVFGMVFELWIFQFSYVLYSIFKDHPNPCGWSNLEVRLPKGRNKYEDGKCSWCMK